MKTEVALYVFLTLLSHAELLLAFLPRQALLVGRSCAHHEAVIRQDAINAHHLQIFPNCNRSNEQSVGSLTKVGSTRGNEESTPAVTGVTLKMAFDSSPEWGVAETSPTSERFTSPQSLDMVHRLRRESSAVLVGRGTVERDNCSLTVRRVEISGEQPIRVVLDPGLKLLDGDRDYAILKDGIGTIIYHSFENDVRADSLSDAVTLVKLEQHNVSDNLDNKQESTISPAEIIQNLSRRGLKHLMVEGGPNTAIQFLDAKLIDRAILVRAPVQFKAPIPAGFNEKKLEEAGLVMIGTELMGGDSVEYWVREGMKWPTPELSSWP